jgi:hypothetical protein
MKSESAEDMYHSIARGSQEVGSSKIPNIGDFKAKEREKVMQYILPRPVGPLQTAQQGTAERGTHMGE